MKATEYQLLFNQKDFQQLTVNVMQGDPLEHRFFGGNPAFQQKIDRVENKTLIRYIVLFYDPKSPLLHKIQDHVERKKAAALIAGFKSDDIKFADEVNEILYCKNREANTMIIEYLRYLKNPEWAYLASAWESYFKILLELASDVKTFEKGNKTAIDVANSRAALSQKASEMSEMIGEKTIKFLSQDTSPYLKTNLFDLIEVEKRKNKITPERQSFE